MLCVKAMIALELAGDVRCVSVIKQNDTNVIHHASRVIDARPNIISFASSTETSARRLSLLEALEPRFSADNENVVCFESAVAAPLVPTFAWTLRLSVK
jgi:hypothetical protein